MGGKSSKGASGGFSANPKMYKSMDQVQRALREAGLESSNLIIGVDFTKSNTWTGEQSFGRRCLHAIQPGQMNPYQRVIDVMCRTLEAFDDDKLFPVYGFGDVTTTDKGVFPFFPDERPCHGISEVLQRYSEIAPHVQMSGPTSFAPLINKAIDIVQRTHQYHILVIIADGQVTSEEVTKEAIVRASSYPLSIIMVGVGDGPWNMMHEFDDGLPRRRFDNWNFVNFTDIISKPRVENFDVEFAVAALQEVPAQFKAMKRLGLLS